MQNILLTISYDGTDFCGWQRQDSPSGSKDSTQIVRTVQGEVENALEKMFRQKISIQGSGRTDSGVHAMGQAANFFSPSENIPEENYMRALNGILPKDIRIMAAKKVDESFNARFSATSRSYRYFITDKTVSADKSRYVWNVHHKMNVENLNEMAAVLKGETDCASFAAAGDASLSTFRYIDKAFFYKTEDETVVFQIEANAFLWKMVRSITGTLIQLDKNHKGRDDFEKILLSCNRSKAGITAPPEGLFLWEVKFDGIRRHI